MTGNVDSNWFRNKFSDNDITNRAVAKKLSIDPAALSLMLRGRRRMQLEEANEIAKMIGEPMGEVASRAGIDVDSGFSAKNSILFAGAVDGEGAVKFGNGKERFISGPRPMGRNARAIQVKSVGSPREFMDGWTLFYSETDSVQQEAISRLSIAAVKDGPVLIRLVRQGYRSGTYNLSDPFGSPMENINLLWASRILWIRT